MDKLVDAEPQPEGSEVREMPQLPDFGLDELEVTRIGDLSQLIEQTRLEAEPPGNSPTSPLGPVLQLATGSDPESQTAPATATDVSEPMASPNVYGLLAPPRIQPTYSDVNVDALKRVLLATAVCAATGALALILSPSPSKKQPAIAVPMLQAAAPLANLGAVESVPKADDVVEQEQEQETVKAIPMPASASQAPSMKERARPPKVARRALRLIRRPLEERERPPTSASKQQNDVRAPAAVLEPQKPIKPSPVVRRAQPVAGQDLSRLRKRGAKHSIDTSNPFR